MIFLFFCDSIILLVFVKLTHSHTFRDFSCFGAGAAPAVASDYDSRSQTGSLYNAGEEGRCFCGSQQARQVPVERFPTFPRVLSSRASGSLRKNDDVIIFRNAKNPYSAE